MNAKLAAFLLAASAALAQEDAQLPAKGADLDLLKEVRTISSRLDAVRGARVSPPPLAVRAPQEIRTMIAEGRVAEAVDADRLEARGRAWADVGIGSVDAPGKLLKALAEDLDGAAYDPAGRRLLVDPNRLAATDFTPEESGEAAEMLLATGVRPDEPLLAHLLTHALQYQRRGGEPPATTTDAILAGAAWAEGEANLVAMLYLFQTMALGREVVERALDPGEVLGGALLPLSLGSSPPTETALLELVYQDGFHQVLDRFRAGGWKKVEEQSSLRRTTRDLLHLDRPPFRASETALEPPAPPQGFVVKDVDSLGEFGIVTLVSQLTGKDNLGLQAGDGWAGDALLRLESAPGVGPEKGFTLWVTRWTTAEEATDFEYGLTRGLGEKHSASFEAGGAGERVLKTSDRVYRSTRSGTEVRLRIASLGVDPTLEPKKKAPQDPARTKAKPSNK